MDIGIYDLNECSNLNYKQRLNIYKDIGFNNIALYIDEKYMSNNETFQEIILYSKKIGLKIFQVHIDYKISNLICDSIEEYLAYVKSRLLICEKYGIKNMVLHSSMGDTPPKVSQSHLNKLANLAEQFKTINLCFENVRNNYNLEQVLNLDLNNIKFCYDLGHANAYKSEYLLDKYINKISCAHLHNNNGKDTHQLLSNGEIDYKHILKILSNTSCNSCLEVFPPRDASLTKKAFIEFVKKAYNDCILD